MMENKIDVHTHAVPPFFHKHLQALQARLGVPVPIVEWDIEHTKQMNDKLGVSTSILSLSAPGPDIDPTIEGAGALAREYNEWAATVVNAEPSRFGSFAALPSLCDTEGCLTEMTYAFDKLQADGVCIFTSYDGKYLGDASFEPIWRELNRRSAVVFIHPGVPQVYKQVCQELFPAVFDFPHETGRTAAHMIVTGTKRRFPNARIILSHGGGTLPLLSERLAQTSAHLFKDRQGPNAPKTAEEYVEHAKSFYFDLALSGTHNVLDLLSKWAPRDRVLYGSDFPYCTVEAEYNKNALESYALLEQREAYFSGNALDLFPRFQKDGA